MPLQEFPPTQTFLNPIISGGTTGSVLFFGSGGAITQNNASFFWDNTSAFLRIGTTAALGTAQHYLKFPNLDASVASNWGISQGWYNNATVGRDDTMLFVGYNVNPTTGGPALAGEPMWAWHLESYETDTDPGVPYVEGHITFVSSGGVSRRPFDCRVNLNTNVASMGLTGDTVLFKDSTAVFTGLSTVMSSTQVNIGVGVTGNNNATFHIKAPSNPMLFESSGASANNKYWDTSFGAGESLTFRAVNDAYSSAEAWLTVERTAAVIDTVTFNNGNVIVTDFLGVGVSPSTVCHVHGATPTLRISSSSTNQSISETFVDNNATQKGQLLYAGANGAGSRYFGFINDGDYFGVFSDTYYFWNRGASGRYIVIGTTELTLNEEGLDVDFRVEGDSASHMIFMDATSTTENIALLATAAPNWQTGDKILFIGDRDTAPTGNPASGFFHYSASGQPTWRDDGGVIYQLTQATGGQNVTNNVTDTASTNGTIPDITNGAVYATDYTNLRNALFQLARMLKQDHDQLRALGILS